MLCAGDSREKLPVRKTKDGRKFYCSYEPLQMGEHVVSVEHALRPVFSARVDVQAQWAPEAAALRALGPGLLAGATRRWNQFALLPTAHAPADTPAAMLQAIERYLHIDGPANAPPAVRATPSAIADGSIDVSYCVDTPGALPLRLRVRCFVVAVAC